MKLIIIAAILSLIGFNMPSENIEIQSSKEMLVASSFSLINDTKEKVSIYTGSGFVSLNKGSKTSITCTVGKEVRWANKGSKGDVIFKVTSDMCGKTVKLSRVVN